MFTTTIPFIGNGTYLQRLLLEHSYVKKTKCYFDGNADNINMTILYTGTLSS